MRTQPDNTDDAGASAPARVEELLARAEERILFGQMEEALALCIEAGSREGLRELAHHCFESGHFDVCLEALRIAQDTRGLIGIGEYLSNWSRDWGEPFFEAAREIRRVRRNRGAHP